MNLTLKRFHSDSGATLGILMVDGRPDPIWFTVERPWVDNKRQISCIPTGTYNVVPHNGKKFKEVWRLENVPGRSAILIHAANYAGQLKGCIAPGLAAGYFSDMGVMHKGVTNSRLAIGELKKIIGYPSSFTLTITE